MTDELTPPSAAPAAPAEGSPSAAPAAAPAGGTGGVATETATPAPVVAKPIKPIPGLDPAQRHREDKPGIPPPPTHKTSADAGDVPTKVADEPPAPATTGFTFADKKFQDQKAAEHSYKTLQGMHKSMVSDREQAIAVANAWKGRAEAAERDLQEARSKPATATPPPGQPLTSAPGDGNGGDKSIEDQFLSTVDWRAYHDLQQQDPLAATMWLATEQTKFFSKFFGDQLSQKFQPIEQRTQVAEALGRMNEMFTGMSEIKLADGRPAYPELLDATQAEEIGRTWRDFGFDPKLLFQPQGLHLAVLQYRHTRAGLPGAAPAVAAASGATNAATSTSGMSAADLAAAASVVSGTSVPAARMAEGGSAAAERAARIGPLKLRAPGILA